MFIDSSAIVSALMNDDKSEALLASIDKCKTRFITSPLSIALSVAELSELKKSSVTALMPIVDEFHKELKAGQANITKEMAAYALGAYHQYGEISDHKAQLNMNQCFSYAVAKSYRMNILHSGNQFIHTDLG